MDDRTLLELAAKAAGLTVLTWNTKIPALLLVGPVAWNPLTDDGDALRLAVKLRIPLAYQGSSALTGSTRDGKYFVPILEPMEQDDCAAVRRAIVRRAAAIGEQMP